MTPNWPNWQKPSRQQSPERRGLAGLGELPSHRNDPLLFTALLYLHVIGATVILGTGTGIAFFMLMAHLSGNVPFIARTAGVVVVADLLFTATAVIVQPITGYLLLRETAIPPGQGCVVLSMLLYVAAGVFWLPVVWMQAQMRHLARTADTSGEPLPKRYYQLFRLWFVFGFPGFGAVLAIIWLMIDKPTF
jgi:uncharacterized membrane protein